MLRSINCNTVFNRNDLKTIVYTRVSRYDRKDDWIRKVRSGKLYKISNNSTSNTNVLNGGIDAPAPRSP